MQQADDSLKPSIAKTQQSSIKDHLHSHMVMGYCHVFQVNQIGPLNLSATMFWATLAHCDFPFLCLLLCG